MGPRSFAGYAGTNAGCCPPAEILRTASTAAETSSGVVNQPTLKRTVPWGKVPSVLWAEGAQWRPHRVKIPNSCSSRKAASALSSRRKSMETTPAR